MGNDGIVALDGRFDLTAVAAYLNGTAEPMLRAICKRLRSRVPGVYAARISLDRTHMQIDDRIVQLAPGVAVTAGIKTG